MGTKSLWIASVYDARGKFTCRADDVSEHSDKKAAVEWLVQTARRRGYARVEIQVAGDLLLLTYSTRAG